MKTAPALYACVTLDADMSFIAIGKTPDEALEPVKAELKALGWTKPMLATLKAVPVTLGEALSLPELEGDMKG